MFYYTMKEFVNDVSSKPTIVYIDYEALFYGMIDQYKQKPDLDSLIAELKDHCILYDSICVFGDFSKGIITSEIDKIRSITNSIFNCQQPNEQKKKDFTDFYVINRMYQDVILRKGVEQVILVAGDNHYSSVVSFLKTHMDKVVGVYGIEGTIGSQLQKCASWVKSIRPIEKTDLECRNILIQCLKSAQEKNIISTFSSTLSYVTSNYSGSYDKYKAVLSAMIADELVSQQPETISDNKTITSIRLR